MNNLDSENIDTLLKKIQPSFTTVPIECFGLVHTSNFLGRKGWALFTGKDIIIFTKNDYTLEYNCLTDAVKLILNNNIIAEGEILEVLATINEK